MNPEKYEPQADLSQTEKEQISHENHEDKDEHPLKEGRNSDIYEVNSLEHELISKYQPKFLAKGGEHIVYEAPEHPNVVVKVATELVKKIIDWNVEHNQPIDSLSPEVKFYAQEDLKQELKRYKQLKKYFGREHVLLQRKFLVKVPITEKILNAMYDGKAPITGNEVWAIMMIQKRAEELNDPKHETLVAGYSEMEDVSPAQYNEVTEHLVFGKDHDQKMEREQLLAVQSNEYLESLVKRSENETGLQEALKDMIERAIAYTEETGEALDLAGTDNVAFFQKVGMWTYRLVDALYPDEKNMVNKTKIALLKLSTGASIDKGEENILMNMLNYVRTINGLAEQFGVVGRINVVPEGMKLGTLDFSKIIRP